MGSIESVIHPTSIYDEAPLLRKHKEYFEALKFNNGDINYLYTSIFLKIDSHKKGIIRIQDFLSVFKVVNTPFITKVFTILDKFPPYNLISFKKFVTILWHFCTMNKTSLTLHTIDIYEPNERNEFNIEKCVAMIKEIHGDNTATLHRAISAFKPFFEENLHRDVKVKEYLNYCYKHRDILLPVYSIQQIVQKVTAGKIFWRKIRYRQLQVVHRNHISLGDLQYLYAANKVLIIEGRIQFGDKDEETGIGAQLAYNEWYKKGSIIGEVQVDISTDAPPTSSGVHTTHGSSSVVSSTQPLSGRASTLMERQLLNNSMKKKSFDQENNSAMAASTPSVYQQLAKESGAGRKKFKMTTNSSGQLSVNKIANKSVGKLDRQESAGTGRNRAVHRRSVSSKGTETKSPGHRESITDANGHPTRTTSRRRSLEPRLSLDKNAKINGYIGPPNSFGKYSIQSPNALNIMKQLSDVSEASEASDHAHNLTKRMSMTAPASDMFSNKGTRNNRLLSPKH